MVTGPPGAGKSTVSRLLVSSWDRGAHVESDRFFNFIASGYVEPWRPESHEQNTAVMRIVGSAVSAYARAGYVTIVDGIVAPRWFYEPLRDQLHNEGFQVAYAILRPSLATCISRAEGRESGERPAEAIVEQLWREFADLGALERHVIETDDEDANKTAERLAERLRAGSLAAY